MSWTLRTARRLAVAVIGATVVLLGIVMLATPGPALVVIPAGLAILATEFAWARHLLKRVRREIAQRTGIGAVQDAAGSEPPATRDQTPASEGRPAAASGTRPEARPR